MGYVIVAGMKAADKALYEFIRADVIRAGLDKTSLIRNIVSKLLFLFDADYVAVFHCDSFADELDQTLCLAAALQTHDQLNHFVHSPFQL